MKHRLIYIYTFAAAALFPGLAATALAQDPPQIRERAQIQDREIHGWQLMTPQERDEYRARMRAAKTMEERERIRQEHQERMQQRAKERGVTLTDEPPPRGERRHGPGGGGMGEGRRGH